MDTTMDTTMDTMDTAGTQRVLRGRYAWCRGTHAGLYLSVVVLLLCSKCSCGDDSIFPMLYILRYILR